MCVSLLIMLSTLFGGGEAILHKTLEDRSFICEMLVEDAVKLGVKPDLVLAMAWNESKFFPDKVSSKGAVGPMQMVPAYWCPDKNGVFNFHKISKFKCDTFYWGVHAIKYLLVKYKKVEKALCAYATSKPYSTCPYARRVLRIRKQITRSAKKNEYP